MIAFAQRELKATRIILVVCAVSIIARWTMWSFIAETPWWGRSLVGGIVGALVLGGLPALWTWSLERERSLHVPVVIVLLKIPALGSLRYVVATMRVNIPSNNPTRASAQMEITVHNDNDFLIEFLARMNGRVNGTPGPRGEISFTGYVYPNQNGYLVYDGINDIPVHDTSYTNDPSLSGILDYDVRYKEASSNDFARESSKTVRIEYFKPIEKEPPGTQLEIPVRVLLSNEHEQ